MVRDVNFKWILNSRSVFLVKRNRGRWQQAPRSTRSLARRMSRSLSDALGVLSRTLLLSVLFSDATSLPAECVVIAEHRVTQTHRWERVRYIPGPVARATRWMYCLHPRRSSVKPRAACVRALSITETPSMKAHASPGRARERQGSPGRDQRSCHQNSPESRLRCIPWFGPVIIKEDISIPDDVANHRIASNPSPQVSSACAHRSLSGHRTERAAPRVVTGSASRFALIASWSVRTFSCGKALAQRRRTITNACENLCMAWRGSMRQTNHVAGDQ